MNSRWKYILKRELKKFTSWEPLWMKWLINSWIFHACFNFFLLRDPPPIRCDITAAWRSFSRIFLISSFFSLSSNICLLSTTRPLSHATHLLHKSCNRICSAKHFLDHSKVLAESKRFAKTSRCLYFEMLWLALIRVIKWNICCDICRLVWPRVSRTWKDNQVLRVEAQISWIRKDDAQNFIFSWSDALLHKTLLNHVVSLCDSHRVSRAVFVYSKLPLELRQHNTRRGVVACRSLEVQPN